jgi:invasion protein IalB
MRKTILLAPLFSLALGGAAAAQEAPAADTAPQEPAEAWGLACQAPAPGLTRCSVFQRQLTVQGEQVILVEIVGLENGLTPAMVMTAPLGISLQSQPVVKIDGAALEGVRWSLCLQQGCIARLESVDLVEKLRAATKLAISFESPTTPPQEIAIDLPVTGLSAGTAAIQNAE